MTLTFNGFSIDTIGTLMTEDQFGWVALSFYYHDSKSNANPSVTFKLPIQYRRDWTVEQVREAALEMAKKLMGDMVDLCGKNALQALQRLNDEQQDG